jgi:hypothetical protein
MQGIQAQRLWSAYSKGLHVGRCMHYRCTDSSRKIENSSSRGSPCTRSVRQVDGAVWRIKYTSQHVVKVPRGALKYTGVCSSFLCIFSLPTAYRPVNYYILYWISACRAAWSCDLSNVIIGLRYWMSMAAMKIISFMVTTRRFSQKC